jgi:hypothetical protein
MQKLKRPWGMGTRTYSQSAQYIRRRMALCPGCGHLHCCGQLEPKSDAAPKVVASLWTVVAFHWQVPEVCQSRPVKAIKGGCHCPCRLWLTEAASAWAWAKDNANSARIASMS